jgi:hypothetical protein
MQRCDRVASAPSRSGCSAATRNAAAKEIRSRSAYCATISSARSPMPRLGTFKMRRRLTVSSGLDSTRR